MALKKEIELKNGIIVNYHRIVSINKIINISNIIEVASYVSKNKREEEENYQNVQKKNIKNEELTEEEKEVLKKGINVFVQTEYINKEYSENENIKEAYEYLKTLDKFKNAEDI